MQDSACIFANRTFYEVSCHLKVELIGHNLLLHTLLHVILFCLGVQVLVALIHMRHYYIQTTTSVCHSKVNS